MPTQKRALTLDGELNNRAVSVNPIFKGETLKVHAVSGGKGQIIEIEPNQNDIFFALQLGLVQISSSMGILPLQPHEAEFLTAGEPYRIEFLADTRARIIMPADTKLVLHQPD